MRTLRLPVLALLAALAGPALAGQARVVRVTGEVTADTYRPFAAFLMDSFDAVVGLDVSFAANDVHADGRLRAYRDGDLFIAYLAAPVGEGEDDSQISAREGFTLADGAYVFDGFYKVVHAGIGQGIVAVFLEPTGALSGAAVEDAGIASLPATAD